MFEYKRKAPNISVRGSYEKRSSHVERPHPRRSEVEAFLLENLLDGLASIVVDDCDVFTLGRVEVRHLPSEPASVEVAHTTGVVGGGELAGE